jgi:hypothetical protein
LFLALNIPKDGQAANPRPSDIAFGTNKGIHDIHMNQGNPSGTFEKDNGIFQDGGLILKFPNRYVGLFLRFQTQWLPTDEQTGNRIASSSRVPAGGTISGGTGGGTPSVAYPAIYIERVLVNPIGSDLGREAIVIGNATSAGVDLTGWSIVDRRDSAEALSGTLAAGESRRIVLSGSTIQLGNTGGTIRLKDAAGNQVHAVSYSKEDAQTEGRYVRFIT